MVAPLLALSDLWDPVLEDPALLFTASSPHLPNSIHEDNAPSSLWLSRETVHPFTHRNWHTQATAPRALCAYSACRQRPRPLPAPEPCTRRQPGRGTASPRDGPAEAGTGRQPSAAGGLALHSSGPTAHTPAGSGWTQQRGDSLSENPGAREERRCSEETESFSLPHIR